MEEKEKSLVEGKNYPMFVEIKKDTSFGYTDTFYKLKEGDYDSFSDEIPYVQAVREFMDSPDISHERIIIVSDEKKFAIKAAMLIMSRESSGLKIAPHSSGFNIFSGAEALDGDIEDDDDWNMTEDVDEDWFEDDEEWLEEDDEYDEEDDILDEEDYEYEDDDFEEGEYYDLNSRNAGRSNQGPFFSSIDKYLRVVDYSGTIPADEGNTLQNQYHQRFNGFPMVTSNDLLVIGLENPIDREKKIESLQVEADKVPGSHNRIMILVPQSELESLWVKNLMRTMGFSMLCLPDCSDYLRSFADSIDKKLYVKIPDFIINPVYPTTQEILKLMITALGSDIAEEDYIWYLRHESSILSSLEKLRSPVQTLNSMIGLEDAKRAAVEFEALALERSVNKKLTGVRQHMLFFGDPGTGKTTVGKIMADILARTGNSRAVFITAGRSDLIGRYVGQTAPKVAERFREARGGILFVDEAGFFLSDDREQGYTAEAIREFVRYMELYDDVTVIFAMYRDEVKDFLALDAGLKSRIGRLVEFSEYTDDELIEIAEKIAFDQGYEIAEEAHDIIVQYLQELKESDRAKFGNARDVRKVVESSIIMYAVRQRENGCPTQKDKVKKADPDEDMDGFLTVDDVKNGIERLKNVDF